MVTQSQTVLKKVFRGFSSILVFFLFRLFLPIVPVIDRWKWRLACFTMEKYEEAQKENDNGREQQEDIQLKKEGENLCRKIVVRVLNVTRSFGNANFMRGGAKRC